MQRQPWSEEINCLACELPTQERLNYFTGQFLTERDFKAEQNYLRGKQLQHNRYLHGWGAVCGLKLKQHPDPACRDRILILEPGLALDCCGREIVVPDCVYIDLIEALARETADDSEPDNNNGDELETDPSHLLISLCYQECKTEFVPALYSDCGCDQTGYGANRVREGFEVVVTPHVQLPVLPPAEAIGVKLSWQTTLNQERAIRVALDLDRNRLYVLSAADPSQIAVYDTQNHCLLSSIAVGGEGLDLALAPTGNPLYAIHRNPETEEYNLLVLDVENLGDPQRVNELPLSSGPLETPPQIAVAFADERVYTLDPNANPQNITIWKTDINTVEVDPTLPISDPASPKYAEVPVDEELRDLAVSPDGVWLFYATTGTDNQVTAARVETLAAPAADWETYSLPLPQPPVRVAVSGDSLRLYVATEDPALHGFQIQTLPEIFPEIGTGVTWEDGAPVDLAVSPSGRWAYVLLHDDDDRGWIRAVSGERLASDPDTAVSEPMKVLANPQDLLLDPSGRRLYAVGLGIETDPCGGVSILAVNEAPCRELLWQALEGCSECPEDRCVPLALIENYVEGDPVTDTDIDNRIRPLVPSTNTLKELILCALEHGTGQQGPEGPQGLPGQDGQDGQDGAGGNPDLPKILDIGWQHRSTIGWDDFLQAVQYDADPSEVVDSDRGLFTLYFNQEMTGIDRQTFKVWIDYPGILRTVDPSVPSSASFLGLYNYLTVDSFPYNFDLQLYGELLPLPGGPHTTPHTNEQSPWAVTFVPHRNSFTGTLPLIPSILSLVWQALQQAQPADLTGLDLPCVHICLKGDFIRAEGIFEEDALENQVLDADNVAGQVGINRDRGGAIQGGRNPSGNLSQGGDFESWFFLSPPENQEPAGVPDTLTMMAENSLLASTEAITAGLATP